MYKAVKEKGRIVELSRQDEKRFSIGSPEV